MKKTLQILEHCKKVCHYFFLIDFAQAITSVQEGIRLFSLVHIMDPSDSPRYYFLLEGPSLFPVLSLLYITSYNQHNTYYTFYLAQYFVLLVYHMYLLYQRCLFMFVFFTGNNSISSLVHFFFKQTLSLPYVLHAASVRGAEPW